MNRTTSQTWYWRLWLWFRDGAPGDIRSTLVGGVVASVITIFWTWVSAEEPLPAIEIHPNEQGYAKPMNAMTEKVKEDREEFIFTFEPAEFEQVFVCEYSFIRGRTGKEMMLSFLDKYSMCFSVIQKSKREYTIRPNTINTAELKNTPQGWFCRCQ